MFSIIFFKKSVNQKTKIILKFIKSMSLLLKSSSLRSSSRSDDIFAEFTSFRDSLKKQYTEKLSKPVSSSTAKHQLQISATKAKLLTESKFGIENLKQNIKDISKTQDEEKKLNVEKKFDFHSMIKDFEGRLGKTTATLKESKLGYALLFSKYLVLIIYWVLLVS